MKRPKKKIPVSDFDYHLPPKLIAQEPTKPRDQARLLILDKKTGKMSHRHFFDLPTILKSGDVLVLNNSKVIPARLLGQKETGGKIEIFLLNKKENKNWQCLIGGKAKVGDKIYLAKSIIAEIIKKSAGENLVRFNASDKKLFSIGETPIPPYIKKTAKLPDYQTIYAKYSGSVAAPTAGLHFTKPLLAKLKKQGVQIEYLTLHVGLGTFQPVKSKYIQDHAMHAEFATIDPKTAKRLNQAKKQGRRIIAVGTTTVRTLEACAVETGHAPSLQPRSQWLNIFIYPGYKFKFVDAMITNFHLPKSTLLMLVSALAGQKNIKRAYAEAIKKKYKFFSFGDAMIIF